MAFPKEGEEEGKRSGPKFGRRKEEGREKEKRSPHEEDDQDDDDILRDIHIITY
jgi:hypothetical protein